MSPGSPVALLGRIASSIAKQRMCVRGFPCPDCEREIDAFEGAGCLILATVALASLLPDILANEDDRTRALAVAENFNEHITDVVVLDIVREWVEEALRE